MTSISKEEVEHVAQLAKLDLNEAEKAKFAEQLSQILTYVGQIQEVSTEGVPLTSSIVQGETALREDTPHECLPLSQTLTNAPEADEGFFIVPNILGK